MQTPAPSAVETLTVQRTRLQEWLARLDTVGGDVPPHVAERVRRDYQERLYAVTEALRGHRDALAAELEDRRAELEDADARLAAAADELEEVRLRRLIGELEEDAWETRRPELEAAVAAARSEADAIRADVERLDTLLRDVAGTAGEPTPAAAEAAGAPASAPAAAEPETQAEPEWEPALPPRDTSDDTVPEYTPYSAAAGGAGGAGDTGDAGGDDLGVDLSWLEEVEQVSAAGPDAPPTAGASPAPTEESTLDEDLAFLAELDRAIAASPQAGAAPGGAADAADRTLDPDRAGMLLCKECGAINEPQLWYCEICGSEL